MNIYRFSIKFKTEGVHHEVEGAIEAEHIDEAKFYLRGISLNYGVIIDAVITQEDFADGFDFQINV